MLKILTSTKMNHCEQHLFARLGHVTIEKTININT